ncbi:unnamed protein product, partial [Anisakis simplex]|uniref:Phlebovirus_G2 domain-containing protein n=1 Tax=Anisakis simplex TaxID=6269 RepID=A0A0M3IZI0_ANISI
YCHPAASSANALCEFRYQATEATLVHGCICSNPTGSCNEVSRSRSYQLENVIQRRAQKDLVYCYSLQYSSSSRFGEEVFKNSGTCEGQYCFVSLTTSELTVEAATSRFDSSEILQSAADHKVIMQVICIKLNLLGKIFVNVGCTIEYAKNISEPLLKHCICATHLCNFYTELFPNARSNLTSLSNRTPLSVALDNTSGSS